MNLQMGDLSYSLTVLNLMSYIKIKIRLVFLCVLTLVAMCSLHSSVLAHSVSLDIFLIEHHIA